MLLWLCSSTFDTMDGPAGVVKWYNNSLPSCGREFDSPHPHTYIVNTFALHGIVIPLPPWHTVCMARAHRYAAFFYGVLCAVLVAALPATALAQTPEMPQGAPTNNAFHQAAVEDVAVASSTVREAILSGNRELVEPSDSSEDTQVQALLAERPVSEFSVPSAFAFWVQRAIEFGIPANTITLILLLPILATIVAFTRVILGLPSLEMLVPIALAYTFVALGISLGLIILGAIVAASFASRAFLRRVQIMQFPKRSISLLFLALFVFAALTASIMLELEGVRNLSIFPVLILTLLGDSIVSVQLRSSVRETIVITLVTIALGMLGFLFATLEGMRNTIILYPELVLLIVPVNIVMGRYFGLRFSEYLRFRSPK